MLCAVVPAGRYAAGLTAKPVENPAYKAARRAKSLLPLSFVHGILNKVRNRCRGSKPVDKAFSGVSCAFFLEKLDENKKCGNHRSTC
ncbi:hypothetical protein HFO42_28825 [Rhizobium leguminosarum]|jgi:hypothetical protein|uniref:Uncharacterized protein n=1 Tax=Rhizobium leguminosarum TaxID=384 RepID=A0AAJ1EGS2_RHILE|nr:MULTISPECIES: hypothetical protein [Rhizobium]MBY3365970.1 hypothetical protein [Rhizobium laguerreae]MBY3386698.1 hypothetical protein [Rhizobium laguerreae]MBY3399941.1 hypothetical protein [Rhizobium laguerreae]MBY3406879.1 hypothetical protein [Rhizobium laguerreae]MBY3512804.1 hypothetical protein [Rhizobium laguerreae]